MLEETAHLDLLRRKKEQQDAEIAAASAAAAHAQSIENRQHEGAMQRVREAERMKRAEKVAWHSLLTQQEHEAAAQRAQIEERKASAAYTAENRLIEARKGEVEVSLGLGPHNIFSVFVFLTLGTASGRGGEESHQGEGGTHE